MYKFELGASVRMLRETDTLKGSSVHKGKLGTIAGRAEYLPDQAPPEAHELPPDPGKNAYLVRVLEWGAVIETRWFFEYEIEAA